MDGYVGKLQRSLGLRGVLHIATMHSQGYGALPPECMGAVHIPMMKPGKKGCDLTKILHPDFQRQHCSAHATWAMVSHTILVE